MQTAPNHSSYSPIDATHGGNVNVTQIEVGQKLIALILALSIMVNLGCFWQMFTAERETRLKEYDLKGFESDEFAPLSAETHELQREVDAMRIQLALRQELRK